MQDPPTTAERRLYARTRCNLPADVDDYETISSGNVLNLCRGGAYVKASMEETPEIGQEVIMTIPFHSRENYLIIKARVAWASSGGIGVTFLTPHNFG